MVPASVVPWCGKYVVWYHGVASVWYGTMVWQVCGMVWWCGKCVVWYHGVASVGALRASLGSSRVLLSVGPSNHHLIQLQYHHRHHYRNHHDYKQQGA